MDFLPAEDGSEFHIMADVRANLDPRQWSMVIADPPCTHLAVSGARWFKEKRQEQAESLAFVRQILECGISRIALENPISIISSHIRRPDQTIQPWQFGHAETKATCLWLRNLPHLQPTHRDGGDLFRAEAPSKREARIHRLPPSPDRWKKRSRTYDGIAAAMADQWGPLLERRIA